MARPKNLHLVSRTAGAAGRYALIVALLLFALLPFAWMLSTSLKPANEIYTTPVTWWPSTPTLDNFIAVVTRADFGVIMGNTLVVAGVSATVSTLVALFAAYGLSRLAGRRGETLVLVLLFAQMIPTILFVIPYFLIFRTLSLLDTLTALVVTNISLTVPIATWLLRRFIAKVPRALDEAALIDGCGRVGALLRVVAPAARAGVGAVFFYAFLVSWHEYLFALSLTSSPSNRVITLGITSLVGQYQVSWGELMALGLLAVVPLIVVFLLVERNLVEGLAGGVKG
ncbi:ABC transporter permease [Acrocarpospora pleiomorpha]|uniref:ABC transporter permease n=1 Tax=Acrocarpospora pleiomorpha TaxID=90975 RepID=A0A5M3X694_9ACTN|nr:carbohydrate ABC transporter permease [Acrocarpospora pleiomorpha]GES17207.1 ABC transporter permease [Acrocarpospora pleiomorpha]